MNYLKNNYHTHTYRCGHADGTEREYIEKAIEAGITELGFSDHTPQPYKLSTHKSHIRMQLCEAEGYAETIRALAAEYKDKIKIRLGVEAEWYPDNFEDLKELLSSIGCEYAILGQHYTKNEYDGVYIGAPCGENELRDYTHSVISAMETGYFSYLCHPDLVKYQGDDETYKDYMKEICVASNALKMPLEINFLGLADGRIYPGERFFSIAAEYNCKVIYGIDAHEPESIGDISIFEKAEKFRQHFGLELVDKMEFKIK